MALPDSIVPMFQSERGRCDHWRGLSKIQTAVAIDRGGGQFCLESLSHPALFVARRRMGELVDGWGARGVELDDPGHFEPAGAGASTRGRVRCDGVFFVCSRLDYLALAHLASGHLASGRLALGHVALGHLASGCDSDVAATEFAGWCGCFLR